MAEKRAEAAERDISHFLSFPSLSLSSAEDTRSGDVLQTGGGLQETSREFETAGSGREGERNGRFKWGGREVLFSFLLPLSLSLAPLLGPPQWSRVGEERGKPFQKCLVPLSLSLPPEPLFRLCDDAVFPPL